MSSVTILGDTSGSVALTAATVAGSTAITIAAQSGTLCAGAPAYRVYATGGTSCPTATFTKLNFAGITFDTNSNYSSSRFTPTVAGYYQIQASIGFLSTSTSGFCRLSIFKNGSDYCDGAPFQNSNYTATYSPNPSVSGLVYCNGTTDYIEIYLYQTSGSTFSTDTGSLTSYGSGYWVRGA